MPHTLLSITYRRLAINAEENQYYPDAAEFRYCSMEVLRWRARYIDGIKHYHRRTVAEKIRSATRVVYLNPLHVGKVVIGGFRWMKGAVQNRRHRAILSVTWWYWLMSGYGEKTIRAASWLFAIVVAFGLLYATRGVIPSSTASSRLNSLASGLVYSFEVSTLRRLEPPPKSVIDRFIVGAETVLGPLQATLLALAIRRKYMR